MAYCDEIDWPFISAVDNKFPALALKARLLAGHHWDGGCLEHTK